MILYFSGTGNSAWVARSLASSLNESEPVEISRRLLDEPTIDLTGHQRVVWVLPVYSWAIPTTVVKFMKRVTLTNGVRLPHFMVVTCGDDTGNIDRQWRRIMSRRGWGAVGCWSVTMPNTYTAMKGFDVDLPELAAEKLQKAPERVGLIANSISEGSHATDIVRGRFAALKSGIIKAWFHRFAMNPRRFNVSDSCISCGKCERVCPTVNVRLVDGRPQWGDNCALCLACYHNCPVHAINYGKSTRSKGQYVCPLRVITKK